MADSIFGYQQPEPRQRRSILDIFLQAAQVAGILSQSRSLRAEAQRLELTNPLQPDFVRANIEQTRSQTELNILSERIMRDLRERKMREMLTPPRYSAKQQLNNSAYSQFDRAPGQRPRLGMKWR